MIRFAVATLLLVVIIVAICFGVHVYYDWKEAGKEQHSTENKKEVGKQQHSTENKIASVDHVEGVRDTSGIDTDWILVERLKNAIDGHMTADIAATMTEIDSLIHKDKETGIKSLYAMVDKSPDDKVRSILFLLLGLHGVQDVNLIRKYSSVQVIRGYLSGFAMEHDVDAQARDLQFVSFAAGLQMKFILGWKDDRLSDVNLDNLAESSGFWHPINDSDFIKEIGRLVDSSGDAFSRFLFIRHVALCNDDAIEFSNKWALTSDWHDLAIASIGYLGFSLDRVSIAVPGENNVDLLKSKFLTRLLLDLVTARRDNDEIASFAALQMRNSSLTVFEQMFTEIETRFRELIYADNVPDGVCESIAIAWVSQTGRRGTRLINQCYDVRPKARRKILQAISEETPCDEFIDIVERALQDDFSFAVVFEAVFTLETWAQPGRLDGSAEKLFRIYEDPKRMDALENALKRLSDPAILRFDGEERISHYESFGDDPNTIRLSHAERLGELIDKIKASRVNK